MSRLLQKYLTSRQTSLSVEVNRILEKCQKEARAVDTESLCIIAGQKVSTSAPCTLYFAFHKLIPRCGRSELISTC